MVISFCVGADEGTYEPLFARIIGQKINHTLLRANFTCCKQHVVGSSFSINIKQNQPELVRVGFVCGSRSILQLRFASSNSAPALYFIYNDLSFLIIVTLIIILNSDQH